MPNGGVRLNYRCGRFGFSLNGHLEATDYSPPTRLVWTVTGDVNGTLRWYLDPEADGTRFTAAATYQVPAPSLIQSLITPVLRRFAEADLDGTLKHVKADVDSRPLEASG